MNNFSKNSENNNSDTLTLEIKMVEQDRSYQPLMYEELPVEFQDELDDLASELLDPDRGHIAVIGSPQAGKTFFINQLVGNIDRYLDRLNRDVMHFVRIEDDDISDIMILPNKYGTYIDAVTNKFNCEEDDICFVTENPEVASKLFAFSKKSRIILEASRSTFMNIIHAENSGDTKMWSSWCYLDVTEVLVKKQDLINTIYLALNERVKETFNVDLTKKMIAMFVSHALKEIPDLVPREGEFKGKVTAPLGIWLTIIRRMGGILGLSESKTFQNKSGEIVLGRLINSTFRDNHDILESYVDNEDDGSEGYLIVSGPDGQMIRIPISGNTLPPMGGSPFGGEESAMDKMLSSMMQGDEKKDDTPKKVKFKDISQLGEKLKKEVIGQDEAIQNIVDGLVVPAAGLNDPKKPIRSMFLLGPTGVGKTKMAITLAEELAEEPMNLVRIDMSEYSQPHEAAKLLGAPPGYAGFDKGGILTNAISQNPCSIILLDEIEKAHPKIWDSFLQIFDAGRMTDGTGVEVDFTQTVIIMTSNIGAKESKATPMGFKNSLNDSFDKKQEEAKRKTMKALEAEFRPELLNRIDEIITFNEISRSTALKIIEKEIGILSDRMQENGHVLNKVSDDILDDILMKSDIEKYGARDIQRVILKNVSNPVAYSMVNSESDTKEKNVFSLFMNKDKKISVTRSLK